MDAATQEYRDQALALLEHAGRLVSLQRKDDPATDCLALISIITPEVLAGPMQQTVITYEAWDFLMMTEDYKVNGAVTTPQRGDKFTDENGVEYEVAPIPGGKHYRYNDPQRVMLRVHTKLVA